MNIKNQFEENGFLKLENIYSINEIEQLISLIEKADNHNPTFRKTKDLFAIRQFHKEVPSTLSILLNKNLKKIIQAIDGNDYFISKSIYFDKPKESNWFVAYHQDLTISVDQKMPLEGFQNWTNKQNQFAVQPPLSILENNFTIRIHLDDTTHENGALKVIEKSHLKGIYRPENIDFTTEKETFCEVKKGGIMLMKPLLLHASNRTTNQQRRRIIHIEFSNHLLPNNLNWSEKTEIPL